MTMFKGLVENLGNVKEMVQTLGSVDEKRLKLFNQILDKLIILTTNPNLPSDPRSMEKVLDVLKTLSTMPLENIKEIHGTVDGIEKLVRTVPAELLAIAKEQLGKKA